MKTKARKLFWSIVAYSKIIDREDNSWEMNIMTSSK